jgi:hypothetical protein
MVRVSKRLVVALKLAEVPAYPIALRAGLHPAVLSRLIHGAEPVREGDRRLLRVAKLLDVPPSEVVRARSGHGRVGVEPLDAIRPPSTLVGARAGVRGGVAWIP